MKLTDKEAKILNYFKTGSDKMVDIPIDLEKEDYDKLKEMSEEREISIEDMTLIAIGEMIVKFDTDKFTDLKELIES
jgi:hypothetical protein